MATDPTEVKFAPPWPSNALLHPCTPLAISGSLKTKIRALRQQQLDRYKSGQPPIVSQYFLDEEVAYIRSGAGFQTYISTSGDMQYCDFGEGTYHKLESPVDVASAVVRWSTSAGLPELIDALPAKPAEAVVCRRCNGTRLCDNLEPNEITLNCCMRCRGLGWTMA